MKTTKFITLVLALTLAACSTTQVTVNYNPATNFSQYKTFTLQQGASAADSIATQMLNQAVVNALTARGFTQVPSGGDLNLFNHFILGEQTQLNTYGYGGWGGRWGGGMQTTQVEKIPTGTVVVDLVDTKSNQLVWRGIAQDTLSTTSTPEQRLQKANAVAAQLLANFPPGSGSK